jgi:drug/metabolite transporter (DMT)-like permease
MALDYKYSHNFKHMIIRNSIFVAHGLALTMIQFYLPLPMVYTINSSAPIFIFIMDYFINGIKINKIQLFSLLFGVIGILFTIND